MDSFLFFVLGIIVVVSIAGCGSQDYEKKKALAVMTAVKDFVVFTEAHKEELPPTIRAKFDELEDFIESQK